MFTVSYINSAIDSIFENTFKDNFSIGYLAKARTSYNIKETENGTVIEVPMVGIPKENVSVELTDGTLTVTGKVDGNTTRKVNARFSLSPNTLPENISSSLKDGLLTITVMVDDKTQPKQSVAIEVK